MKRAVCRSLVAGAVTLAALLGPSPSPAEVILQYFNTSWKELTDKLPELAEAGYGALWLPPPTKGSGGLSVGYDCWDPFDLGSRDQRGTVRTRYGTEEELLRLIATAHRFGIRVYVDNIMNHRAFDVPGYNADTPLDVYPGMLPEDFHLRVTPEGFYRKWDNVANWGDTWQVQYRNFSDLIDIAQESPDNGNFGVNEGDHIPKLKFVRHPNNPERYCFAPSPTGAVYVGFYSTNITLAVLNNPTNAWLFKEDVNAYLIRAVRWLVDRTKVDGLRLDAVKHVPAYFFGEQWAAGKDASGAGYCGQAQEQFNLTRGYNDWNNHRDTVFDTEQTFGRNDLMMFGEHLGEPPAYADYIAAGMRLVDNRLHGFLNNNLGQPWGYIGNLQYPGGEGFSDATGVAYVKSHDDDFASRPELHYALICTRRGLPNIYTDGNHQSETLGASGGAFPRHANTAFLGQFGDNRIPNLAYIHNHFARGDQVPRGGDAHVAAYERRDKRENPSMSDADGTVLFFCMNDDYSAGAYREMPTAFRPGDYLWQYSSGGGAFYYTVPSDQKIKVIVPPGGYFAFSWRNPEESTAWSSVGGRPVEIYANDQPCGWVSYVRRDGPDGDPAFNPYGVDDPVKTDYAYTWSVPRVASSTNIRFVVRADGSAENVLMKLDGGMDLNGIDHVSGDPRDHPPGNPGSTEVFEGYEQASYVHRIREKFAAADVSRNIVGSQGAETYQAVIGAAGFATNPGSGANSAVATAAWAYHKPDANDAPTNRPQFDPAPESAAGSNVTVWLKTGYQYQIDQCYLYYTTDGARYPEGSGGEGRPGTQVARFDWKQLGAADANGTPDWWAATLPPLTNGTVLRYKIGVFNHDAPSLFPIDAASVYWKKRMVTRFEIANFNAAAASYRPHDDFAATATGLTDGFHVLRARAFLKRDGNASIYSTFVQPFYLDAQTPRGEIKYPNENDTLGQNAYEVVVRTDPTATAVWFHIDDGSAANDDAATGQPNGNGFMTNALGVSTAAWVQASAVIPTAQIQSPYPGEWRFSYRNIPPGGSNATLRVRLLELSSSTNLALGPAEGHYTELVRNVKTAGPDQTFFFQWPDRDGTAVRAGWTIRLYFSKSLGDAYPDDSALLNSFLIAIDGYAQGRNLYRVTRDIDGTYGQIEYDLPDLYNGDPALARAIRATHTTPGNVVLEATRTVRFEQGPTRLHVDITQPPEYDSDGKPYEIVLPDVANPRPEDRQSTIRVETDPAVIDVWIQFTNSVGGVVPLASTTNALSGRVSVTQGSNLVVGAEAALSGLVTVTPGNALVNGAGTLFSNELAVGSTIRIDTNLLTVTQIVSQTALVLAAAYPDAGASNVAAFVQPAFDGELGTGATILIAGNRLTVSDVLSRTNGLLTTPYPGATATGLTAYRLTGGGAVSGSFRYWDFLWTNMTAGLFHFYAFADTNGSRATIEGQAFRNVRVVLREVVPPNPDDLDDDDDGLYDGAESNPTNLPNTNPETWLNGQVHIWRIYGRTDPLKPDTDGDGLPDGLESGWRMPIDPSQTDTNADTNGDGWPNFIGDLDPPFYNTVPDNSGLPKYVFNDSRTKLIHGTMTDPSNPDTDYDGIPDGIEDANRNGWVDGDGKPLRPGTSNPWIDRPTPADWPTGQWTPAWKETDPNNPDTDGDGLPDGYGEDTNFNGHIDGDLNSNRVWEAGELWQETDPLNPDTDGDGLPDGWERRYQFDPLDDGIIGHTNMHSGLAITNDENGAYGNPDGDWIVVNGVTNAYVNILEYQNGTNPRRFDGGAPPPPGGIAIGPGPVLGPVNGVTNRQEFTDWHREDCLALDEYEGDGINNQGGDVYMAYDGWDTSRDLVAFYARDGGDIGNGGDGQFYFRVDLHDLKAHAEEGHLDIYVVIDFGNPASGEVNLPDEVDAMTDMRWEAVVACYQSGQGRVYLDLDHAHNTTAIGQDLAANGVVARDQATPNGFLESYYNSDLDAVEFSVSRQALIDAGWNGLAASNFNYQVYTTMDGTRNNPVGPGDIGGRNDIRDSITDDWVAEDYWQAQQGIENTLRNWIPGTSRAGRAKVALLFHGNQAIRPGSDIQALVNTGAGAGYYRPFDVHEVYGQPLNLHVTPTLASAIAWAAADPAAGQPWRDGPALNRRIARLAATNVVHLLGSTFSDHILPYFTPPFNRDNEQLARDFLGEIFGYGRAAPTVFWPPERVLDPDTLGKIADMGYGWTVLDQDTHLYDWFGREESLRDGGYRVNELAGVKCFVINNLASTYRFGNTDGGADIALRTLLNRKARAWSQDQVIVLFGNWEDFVSRANADAYDLNVRWLANRPWTEIVALDDIAAGRVDVTGDGVGDAWGWVHRDTSGLYKQGHNWVNHATQSDYDHWYMGQGGVEESLNGRRFQIRPGVYVPTDYGMLYTTGVVAQAWSAVQGVANTNLARLARAALHASVFETAFHNEDNNDLRRYSTGEYMYPATSYNTLSDFARNAQAQTRVAAIYRRVDDWAATAAAVGAPRAQAADVDLDGEDEYLLYNDRVFALFERIGGRLVGAWTRDVATGDIAQVIGNPAGYSGSETEEEGASNVATNGAVAAYRTSGLKDWWAGTSQYVNQLYSFTGIAGGWQAASADSNIVKRIVLAAHSGRIEVDYTLSGGLAGQTLYVRHGLSPDLGDLLRRGQASLAPPRIEGGVVTLANTNAADSVSAAVAYADAGHSAAYNPLATDENTNIVHFTTVPMRNQAQTHQVEISGTGHFTFALVFGAQAADSDGDGMPNDYERRYSFLNPTNAADATTDYDGDGVNNRDEYVAGTRPDDPTDYLRVSGMQGGTNGIVVRFPAKPTREYRVWYDNVALTNPVWSNATPAAIVVDTERIVEWLDDGSQTAPPPAAVSNRFYRVNAALPR